MGNDLVTTGGGAVVPASTGGAVGDYVGDVSLDRGTVAPSSPSTAARPSEKAVGMARLMRARVAPLLTSLGLSEQQKALIDAAFVQAAQTGEALDQGYKTETQQLLLEEWGDAYNYNVQTITEFLLDVCGGKDAYDRVIYSRDDDARCLTSDANLLGALLAYARKVRELERAAAQRPSGQGNVPRLDVEALRREERSLRLREIEGWMGSRDARYFKDEAVQAEYRELLDQGATRNVIPTTTDADVKGRIAEIEKWMSARKGSEEHRRYYEDPQTQEEYRQLLQRREEQARNGRV